ncbi:MAG: hypothetical protein MJ109_07395, partial [Kiritimatiellae bacterium]|nr:hypothetical protein [Kiritimatiellia bacterium]
DLRDFDGLENRRLLELLTVGRRFRLPDGTGVILGRDQEENAILKAETCGVVVAPKSVPGPTALLPNVRSEADLELARNLVCAYSKYDKFEGDIELTDGVKVPRPYSRDPFKAFQIC